VSDNSERKTRRPGNAVRCVSTQRPSPRLARYDPVVSYTPFVARRTRVEVDGYEARMRPRQIRMGSAERMGGEVIVRKNASRRRTTRSGIIFYEGIVSVLYIGSLTTRCSVTACRSRPYTPCSRFRVTNVERIAFPRFYLFL